MRRLLVIPVIISLIGCAAHRKELHSFPPGTALLSDNFYMDVNNIRNLDYLECLHWYRKMYGGSSPEYLSMLPDKAYIVQALQGKVPDSLYIYDPAFRNFAAMGISRAQAEDFCKWRTDRVFQFLLIREGILKYDAEMKDVFTVEKYFRGEYHGLKADTTLQVPVYTLVAADDTRCGFRAFCSFKTWPY